MHRVEEIFIRDFREIQKYTFQIFKEIRKKTCFFIIPICKVLGIIQLNSNNFELEVDILNYEFYSPVSDVQISFFVEKLPKF